MWQALHASLRAVDQRLPLLRSIMPKKLHGAIRDYLWDNVIPTKVDRRWMKEIIFPALVKTRPSTLLFVGCARYTRSYRKLFPADIQYWTVDSDPKKAKWGSSQHVTCDVTNVDKSFNEAKFDVVLLNGVLGWGVDSEGDVGRTLDALRQVLRTGGLLIIGWNQGRVMDPLTHSNIRHFRPSVAFGLPARKVFTDSSHIYDVLVAV